jgi:uncharacterized membrane protein
VSAKAILWHGLLVLALLGSALPAAARQLAIQNFDAQITVQPDATIEVTEIIRARFTGSWNGIYRSIPVEYVSPQGFNYTLFLDVTGVTDDDGRPLKYEVSRERNYKKIKIWVPGANDAVRTIIITYRVEDGLRFFEDHDELYWNITGNEWEVPIEHATAQIELPAAVTGLRTMVYTGGYGAREQDAETKAEGNTVQVRMLRRLSFHEGMTAVVGWDKGAVHEPGLAAKTSLFLRSNWPFAIPLIIFVLMFLVWYRYGRDPRLRPIAVAYEPPTGLSPGEVGTLVDNEAGMRDITATLVDLAVRGFLVIEQKGEDGMMGLIHHRDYTFHLQRPPAEWTSAKPHEQEILGALFDGGANNAVSLSELQNHFYTHLPAIRDRIFDALIGDHYYLHRPDKVRRTFLGAGIAIGVLGVWGGAILSRAMGVAPLTVIVTSIATGLVVCGFGWFMPARTVQGAHTLEGVLGFEDFLGHVEEDRFERMIKTPEMFEKFLPYAMALGVEKKWVRAFAEIYRQPPNWYRGPYGANFQPIYFVNDLDTMSNRAGAVMASAPRSSGSSGFGGGGFSGGGFGGGGGGGF